MPVFKMNPSGPDGAANLPEYLLARIQAYGDKVAQIDSSTGESVTFHEIWLNVQRTGHWLRKEGVGRGTTVGICLENCLDFTPLLLGVLQAGGIAALFSPSATQRELDHLISISNPRIIFAPNAKPEQKNAILNTPGIRLLTYRRSELEAISSSCDPVEQCPADLDSYALFLSSSGSTGLPKAVIIKHSNLLWAISIVSSTLMEEDKPALGLMPFSHGYGLGLMLIALKQGSPFILMKKLDIKVLNSAIIKYNIRQIHAVPSFLTRILTNEMAGEALSHIDMLFTAGASVSPLTQLKTLEKLRRGAKLCSGFGMSETTHVTSFGEVREDKPGSCGKMFPHTKIKIIDKDGLTLEPGKQGELCLQGPMITCGYYNNTKATEDAFTSDKWFRTGDLAYVDTDGYLYIVDRIKNIILFQGYSVSTTELEIVISEYPGVKEAAVVGVQHDVYGEVPRAFIVRDSESEIREEDIQGLVSKELSYYKWLRGGVRFVESLPKTASLKVNRALLKTRE